MRHEYVHSFRFEVKSTVISNGAQRLADVLPPRGKPFLNEAVEKLARRSFLLDSLQEAESHSFLDFKTNKSRHRLSVEGEATWQDTQRVAIGTLRDAGAKPPAPSTPSRSTDKEILNTRH